MAVEPAPPHMATELPDDQVKAFLDASPDAMVIVDSQGLIVLVNSRTVELFGYAREELLGQEVEILVPERFREKHPANRARFFTGPQARAMGAGLELYGRRKDGSEFPVWAAQPATLSIGDYVVVNGIVGSQWIAAPVNRMRVLRMRYCYIPNSGPPPVEFYDQFQIIEDVP